MSTARSVHHAVCVIRTNQCDLDEIYKYLTINETNFEFDINAESEAGGMTVLHAACAANNDELTQELLLLGANPNQVTKAGRTPLMEALEAKSLGCVKILLSHGAVVTEDKQLQELLSNSTDAIKRCVQLFLTGQADKEAAIIRSQKSWIKMKVTEAKIALLAKRIEANIERYKYNASSFFGINNSDKATRLETALQSARQKVNTFTSVQEFLNYKNGDAESINEVLSARRIGFTESDSKKEVDALVRGFKL